MRQITQRIVHAFEGRYELRIDNSRTDGTSLWLFGNKIAEWREDGLWISNGGWDSKTTKERLNGLTGIYIRQHRGTWWLNSREWDGRWVNVDAWNDGITYVNDESPREENEQEFDVTSEWTNEGYSRPVYAVFHTLVEEKLREVENVLEDHGIAHRRMESDTEGRYQPNYFIVVRPEEHQNASWLVGYLQEGVRVM